MYGNYSESHKEYTRYELEKDSKKSIVWIMLLCFAVLIFGEIMPVRAAGYNKIAQDSSLCDFI